MRELYTLDKSNIPIFDILNQSDIETISKTIIRLSNKHIDDFRFFLRSRYRPSNIIDCFIDEYSFFFFLKKSLIKHIQKHKTLSAFVIGQLIEEIDDISNRLLRFQPSTIPIIWILLKKN